MGFVARFLALEAAGGLLLIAAAILALVIANSPLAPLHAAALHARLGPLTVELWINDALMALFFFTVGLEVKRELVEGELSRPGSRLLPVSAAMCGMIVPALVYLAVAGSAAGAARGWAVPAATDIAFAQAVLLLAGRRAPPALRLFLTTLAIIDDIGAVAIIALVYTARIDPWMLAGAAAILAAMWQLGRHRPGQAWPFLLLGGLLWIVTFRSGVHATVAGVLAALVVPMRRGPDGTALLVRLETVFHPWVVYGVLPLFGFANAALPLGHLAATDVLAPIPLGIALGLVIGKQLGVTIGIALPIRLGLAARPAGTSRAQLHAMAVLAGIGFTMSLFIGGLAFADPIVREQAKLGVLGGSVLSAAAGYILLRLAGARGHPDRRIG